MEIIQTGFDDLYVVQPKILKDKRGYFFESYNSEKMAIHNIEYSWLQDNEAMSNFGVLRGLHYQCRPMAQAKLVRVVVGKVQDVVVDIRPDKPTYGQHYSIILSEENKTQLLVPHGFAHGYLVLSETAIFSYKCDQLYSRDDEAGIKFDDQQLHITWELPTQDLIISDKDHKQPAFGTHKLY